MLPKLTSYQTINKLLPKTVWVATVKVELSQLEGNRTIAIVMNASTFEQASDVDYFITNVSDSVATAEWIVTTSFRFMEWLNQNRDVFIAYKAALGFVWG